MKINCHTNLDINPCERWPEELPCRPMVGDIIVSSTGLELEVVRIKFRMIKMAHIEAIPPVICDVELHLPKHRFENISAFEKWYEKRNK